jgi:hypothetical protein
LRDFRSIEVIDVDLASWWFCNSDVTHHQENASHVTKCHCGPQQTALLTQLFREWPHKPLFAGIFVLARRLLLHPA